ncbi:MAG: NYN domain-containing protein [Micrococcus sp.]|nr:NYN domain-containing protein [Micrococcus sp.]
MPSSSPTPRIAVLIDCDNVSPTHAGAVLEELATHGIPTIKRAYGDWTTTNLVGWKRALNDLAIQPVQQFAYTYGKNSTDSALIIDAMDLLWMGHVDAFALVSSDSDFTRLATRLRESGKRVIGLGERKTPASLRNAVDQFVYLELLGGPTGGEASSTTAKDGSSSGAGSQNTEAQNGEPTGSKGGRRRAASSSGAASGGTRSAEAETSERAAAEEQAEAPRINLQSALVKAVNATSDDDGWASLGVVGQHLSRAHVDFDPRDFGHQKLSTLVAEQAYLLTRSEGRTLQVSLKQGRSRR